VKNLWPVAIIVAALVLVLSTNDIGEMLIELLVIGKIPYSEVYISFEMAIFLSFMWLPIFAYTIKQASMDRAAFLGEHYGFSSGASVGEIQLPKYSWHLIKIKLLSLAYHLKLVEEKREGPSPLIRRLNLVLSSLRKA
jgi:hypothetical protein